MRTRRHRHRHSAKRTAAGWRRELSHGPRRARNAGCAGPQFPRHVHLQAWYPLTGRWPGFQDARVTIDPAGTFAAKLLIDGARTDGEPPLTELRGRFLTARGLVATAVTVP